MDLRLYLLHSLLQIPGIYPVDRYYLKKVCINDIPLQRSSTAGNVLYKVYKTTTCFVKGLLNIHIHDLNSMKFTKSMDNKMI